MDLIRDFKDPGREYSVLAFWFLNGELKKERLAWQIGQMVEKVCTGALCTPGPTLRLLIWRMSGGTLSGSVWRSPGNRDLLPGSTTSMPGPAAPQVVPLNMDSKSLPGYCPGEGTTWQRDSGR